jgi:Fe-S-cluster-containing dehydrogenase component/formate-dependent nitrite reductase membrane component NrfD
VANYGFIIDNRKCIGCHACTVACKSEHDVPIGVNRTWVKYIEKGTFPQTSRLFSVLRCNHCDNAPCVEICPVTALYRRADGIVDFDNRRCIGCRACMQACPYDALYIDPETRTAAKCNYCAHRVDRGLEPACVNVCPTHAIISGDLDDPQSEIAQLRDRHHVTARKPEKGTLPALYYIDGDIASLNPTAAASTTESVWGAQTRGVGHYARSAHAPATSSAASQGSTSSQVSATPVRIVDSLEKFLSLGEDQTGVLEPNLHPANGKGQLVAHEVARRTYDAPQKGILWGWQVAAYMWTKAIATGAVIVPLLAGLLGNCGASTGLAAVGVIVGGLFLAATGALLAGDLDQPKRFIYVLLRPQWRSWLVRGAYIISAYGLCLALWLLLASIGRRAGAWFDGLVIALAIATAVYTAFLFSQAKGRDFWQSPLLGAHMLCHAGMAGGATFLFGLPLADSPLWIDYVGTLTQVALVARLACDGLELTTAHATADAAAVAMSIVRGRYARWYWGAVVGLGAVVPLAMLTWLPSWTWPVAAVAILAGIYVSEHIWVRAPQRIPLA